MTTHDETRMAKAVEVAARAMAGHLTDEQWANTSYAHIQHRRGDAKRAISAALPVLVEGIAEVVEAIGSFAHGENETSKTFLIGYGTAKRRAAAVIRNYGTTL